MNHDFNIKDEQLNKFILYYKQFQEKTDDSRILYSFKSPDFKITIYNTKKVLFQGKKAYDEYAIWAKHFGYELEPEMDETIYENEYIRKTVIGSDEVGTGDFFGPVVVCAAYVKPSDLPILDELKVRDSKTMSDKQIIEIGSKLVQEVSYHVISLSPEKYNELTKKGYNMNKIKAYLHNHAIKKMVSKHPKVDHVILDEYCSPKNYFSYLEDEEAYQKIDFHTKAESVHKAVAVASIIARYKFLLEMDRISKEIGITVPKGSGAPADAIAKVIYLQKGIEIFSRIAKVHFKNYEKLTQ